MEIIDKIKIKDIGIRHDLLRFFFKPDCNKFPDLNIREKSVILLKLLILSYTGLFLASLPTTILQEFALLDNIHHKASEFYEELTLHDSTFKPYYLFSLLFFIPLLEELGFRLFLGKFNLRYFLLSLSLLNGMLIFNFVQIEYYTSGIHFFSSIMPYIYIIIMALFTFVMVYPLRKWISKIGEWWNNHPKSIFYFIVILFSFAHINSINSNEMHLFPIFLLPYFVYGFAFGYTRVRLGITYSIILHFLFLLIHFGLRELIYHYRNLTFN
jgi:membrane protease YdiL (CAAX protease family)